MSIELPTYTIHESVKESSKLTKLIVPLLVLLAFMFGYLISSYFIQDSIGSLRLRNEILEDQNTSNKDQIAQLSANLSILETDLKVKNEAISQLQQQFKASITTQNELQSEINFYSRLLSPDAENKGLRVFETSVSKLGNNAYALKTTLVQKLEKAKVVSGKYEIYLMGKQNNQSKKLLISSEDDSNYEFKYFHKISSNFYLPDGYIAEQLVVKLQPKNKKSKSVQQTISWNTLTKGIDNV